MTFSLIAVDTETTGLELECDVIELSLYKMNTDEVRTWCLAPLNVAAIQPEALRINGHLLNDILHKTAEGRDRYRKPDDVIVEIENWLMEDGIPSDNRVLLGHNVNFDKDMLIGLWKKCNSSGTIPFSEKYGIDTMQIEFAFDYAIGKFAEGYSLRNLAKKYGIKNEKAHSSESDTKCTVAIYREQMKVLKSLQNV